MTGGRLAAGAGAKYLGGGANTNYHPYVDQRWF